MNFACHFAGSSGSPGDVGAGAGPFSPAGAVFRGWSWTGGGGHTARIYGVVVDVQIKIEICPDGKSGAEAHKQLMQWRVAVLRKCRRLQ